MVLSVLVVGVRSVERATTSFLSGKLFIKPLQYPPPHPRTPSQTLKGSW